MAAFITKPLDVVTFRLMAQGDQKSYSGLWNRVRETVRQGGIRGSWRGSLCRTIAIIPSTGIYFSVNEIFKRLYFNDTSPHSFRPGSHL
ncbi:hypothetical protein ABG067_007274 [Albugo candida]